MTTILEPEQGLIILSCSREKLVTTSPVPAWELYQGACVPALRQHFATDAARRARVRVLSGALGLLHPDDTVDTYDRRLTTRAAAHDLHWRCVAAQLDAELAASPSLQRVLIVVEPLYLLALRRLYDHLPRLRSITVVPDPQAWPDALAELRAWGWT